MDLCLFDLDQTLVQTDDLIALRESAKDGGEGLFLAKLQAALANGGDRRIYSREVLDEIRGTYPQMKLGIFTRAPRDYVLPVLAYAYPGFAWDVVIAYGDVRPTKPSGKGVELAMKQCDVRYINHVVMVGDIDVDLKAAYNAGVWAVLDRSAWPAVRAREHWNALELVADGDLRAPGDLLEFLSCPDAFLPELERLLSGTDQRRATPRYDEVGKFIPREVGGDNTRFVVHAAGRSFAGYESLQNRKQWHALTKSIGEQKDAKAFPDEWIHAIETFIRTKLSVAMMFGGLTVTVIPHRPEREPRLERLLAQLAATNTFADQKASNKLTFAPGLLAYRDGVRSQHGDHLKKLERFKNVRDHLYVPHPKLILPGRSLLVIDDVVTTGSTLIYATKYLKDAGVHSVTSLAMAMNITNVAPH